MDPSGSGMGGPGMGMSMGMGLPGMGAFSGAPWGGDGFGWGAPYVPVTPLGGLWGLKGDLLLPIVGIGFAIFILILIVLAVKYALAWKLDLLSDVTNAGRRLRDIDPATETAHDPDYINQLSAIVLPAIVSKGCNDRLMCELGSMARERKELPSLFKFLENLAPQYLHDPLSILRISAEKPIVCATVYPCPDAHEDEQSNEIIPNNPNNSSSPLSAPSANPNMAQADQPQLSSTQQQQQTSPKFLQGLGGKPKK
jgi:hypothetical protein